MQFLKKDRGFTLIELLVVISIIGVLATIILSSLGDARERARDARRESDIKTIQNALEMYYVEHGQYPNGAFASGHTSWPTFETVLGTSLPSDPVNDEGWIFSSPYDELQYGYYSSSTASWCSNQLYFILYNMETKTDTDDNRVTLCNGGTSSGYGGAFLVGISPRE